MGSFCHLEQFVKPHCLSFINLFWLVLVIYATLTTISAEVMRITINSGTP